MSQAKENRKKYLKAPSVKQIDDFILELGVSASQFERFMGIPTGTIRAIHTSQNDENSKYTRELPAKFWHFIYEKKVPAYGSGFLDHPDKKMKFSIKSIRGSSETKVETKPQEITQISDKLRHLMED